MHLLVGFICYFLGEVIIRKSSNYTRAFSTLFLILYGYFASLNEFSFLRAFDLISTKDSNIVFYATLVWAGYNIICRSSTRIFTKSEVVWVTVLNVWSSIIYNDLLHVVSFFLIVFISKEYLVIKSPSTSAKRYALLLYFLFSYMINEKLFVMDRSYLELIVIILILAILYLSIKDSINNGLKSDTFLIVFAEFVVLIKTITFLEMAETNLTAILMFTFLVLFLSYKSAESTMIFILSVLGALGYINPIVSCFYLAGLILFHGNKKQLQFNQISHTREISLKLIVLCSPFLILVDIAKLDISHLVSYALLLSGTIYSYQLFKSEFFTILNNQAVKRDKYLGCVLFISCFALERILL